MNALSRRGLRALASCVAPQGDDGTFEKYLRWNDTDISAVRTCPGASPLPGGCPLAGLVQNAGRGGLRWVIRCPDRRVRSQRPLPFETLSCRLFISACVAYMKPRIRIFPTRPRRASRLARSLLETLVRAAKDAFYLEFAGYRASAFAPLALFIYREADALYGQFIAQCRPVD